MSYASEHIASTLKQARESRGLSQRALSKKAGVPQGHISKIENGAVDLRLSSLVALARVLDLELMLVPRNMVPAVKSITRSSDEKFRQSTEDTHLTLKELKRLQDAITGATQLHPAVQELAQLQRQVRELTRLQIAIPEIKAILEATKAVQAFKVNTKGLDAIREALSEIQKLRNVLAHTSVHVTQIDSVRPAYTLDEDDHG